MTKNTHIIMSKAKPNITNQSIIVFISVDLFEISGFSLLYHLGRAYRLKIQYRSAQTCLFPFALQTLLLLCHCEIRNTHRLFL